MQLPALWNSTNNARSNSRGRAPEVAGATCTSGATTGSHQHVSSNLACAYAKNAGARRNGGRISVIAGAVASPSATAERTAVGGRPRSTWRKLAEEDGVRPRGSHDWGYDESAASDADDVPTTHRAAGSASVAANRINRGMSPGRGAVLESTAAMNPAQARMQRLRSAMANLDNVKTTTGYGSPSANMYDDEAWLFGCNVSALPPRPSSAPPTPSPSASPYTSAAAYTPAAALPANFWDSDMMKITADDETAKKLGSAAMAAARLSMSVGGLSPGRQRRRTSGVSLPMPWESATKSAAHVDMAAAGPGSVRRQSPAAAPLPARGYPAVTPQQAAGAQPAFGRTTLSTASTDEDEDNAAQYNTAGSKGYGAGYGASYGVGAFNYDRYHDDDSQLVSDQRIGQDRSLSVLMRSELNEVAASLPGGPRATPSPAPHASHSMGNPGTGHTTTSFHARPTARFAPGSSASKPTPTSASPTGRASASPASASAKPAAGSGRAESPLFIICRRDWRAEMEEATGVRKGAVGSRSPSLDDEAMAASRRRSPKPVAPGPETVRAPSNWRSTAEGEMGYSSIFSSPGSANKKTGSPASLLPQARSRSAGGGDNRSSSCKMTPEERAARDRRLQGWRDLV
ncbi:hypothetical protein HYH02_003752 [Chlamydomonas schloesseri]|uniref:Uncharacterized protein n=1 Tax=Chlamydomonas schloesseri TaxID=2026947 RepID=A0A835WSW9_9CHLO|nr:hypothetical protein HYH02_003752 [Chlamydomonas schloesseri]|eukprot:KAG2451980.1 hypothetical protein HYH02_003752 [Chlamydomonas schloesseri]